MPSRDVPAAQPVFGTVLIVDNDAELAATLCDVLRRHGYAATDAAAAHAALDALRIDDIDVLLTDLHMPEMDGITLLGEALAIDPDVVPIVMTGHATVQTAVKAIKHGAFDYVEKPLSMPDLLPMLARAVEVRRLRRENLQLRETLGIYELTVAIGFTLEIDTLLNKVMDAALQQCDANEVSILLPTPSGNELYIAGARGKRREIILGQRVTFERGIAGWVARHNEAVILNGNVDDPRFAPSHPRPEIHCAISMPMMVGGKSVGVLNVNCTRPCRPFTLGQVKALNILTGTAAPALKAASLHAQVQAAKEEWEQCFDAVTDGIFITNGAGFIQRANKAMREWFEPILGDVIGQDHHRIWAEGNGNGLGSPVAAVLKTGEPLVQERTLPMLKGWYLVSCYPLLDRDGTPCGAVCALRDITARKKSEAAIVGYNERLKLLHEIDCALIAGKEPATIAQMVLPLLRNLIGAARVVVNLFDLATGEVEWLAAVGRKRTHVGPRVRYSMEFMGDISALRRGEVQHVDIHKLPPGVEVEALRASGVHTYVVVPMMARGDLIGAISFGGASTPFTPEKIGIAKEVATQFAIALMHARLLERIQRQAEELEDQNQTLTTLINASPLAIVVVDGQDRVKVWNQAAHQTFGWSAADVCGKPIPNVPLDKQGELQLIQNKEKAGKAVTGLETCRLRRDGQTVDVMLSTAPLRNSQGAVIGAVQILADITARKNLEIQLRQAQKMEAFGQLAGGVAHDFNNLLTIITGYSELILSGSVEKDKEKTLLREIRKAGERAAGLTRQLLAFSRKQVLQMVDLNLNALVSETEKMLRRLIGEDIDLAASLDPNLGLVRTDAGQMEQVIMNLVVNARDAMPKGGQLTIETRNVELDQNYADEHTEIRPGKYVMLAVADSGCGMDEATKAKIFEPFFTTKEVGKGTGLGLATVHGIIKQSGGSIEVYSEPDVGSTFKIYLPRVASQSSMSNHGPNASLMPRGNETILLAEDDDAVRATIRLVLEFQGYTVLAVPSGDQALEICRQRSEAIQLLMTDVVMPKTSGRQLADSVLAIRPEIKILYLSGYTDDAVVRHGVLEAGVAFLQKPFTPLNLARKVREVLDR